MKRETSSSRSNRNSLPRNGLNIFSKRENLVSREPKAVNTAAVMAITSKLGKVVVTNIHPWDELDVALSMTDLTLSEKTVQGSLFGSANPRADIPRLADLYRKGQLDLDGMITRTYPIEEINQGYQDMRDGKNIRGVIIY